MFDYRAPAPPREEAYRWTRLFTWPYVTEEALLGVLGIIVQFSSAFTALRMTRNLELITFLFFTGLVVLYILLSIIDWRIEINRIDRWAKRVLDRIERDRRDLE